MLEGEPGMKVTFFGTTMLLFDDGTDQVLFDGHFTRPPLWKYLLNGKIRTDKAMADELMSRYDFSRLRAVFVSHSHPDHVMDVPYIANRTGAEVYGSDSTKSICLGGKVPKERIHLFRDDEAEQVGAFRVTALPSLHSAPTIISNDLGKTIKKPVRQPARVKKYREGGSRDFLVEHGRQTFLIRPSFNYIEGQLDDVRADVLFLGIGTMDKASGETIETFFAETLDKVRPQKVIPLHWDDFFTPLDRPIKNMPRIADNTPANMDRTARACAARGIEFIVQYPLITLSL